MIKVACTIPLLSINVGHQEQCIFLHTLSCTVFYDHLDKVGTDRFGMEEGVPVDDWRRTSILAS